MRTPYGHLGRPGPLSPRTPGAHKAAHIVPGAPKLGEGDSPGRELSSVRAWSTSHRSQVVAARRKTVCHAEDLARRLARQQMKLAATAGGRQTADTVHGGHEKVMRQTVIGMVAGARLAEHENPGEATVLVLRGRVRLSAADHPGRPFAGTCSSCPITAIAWRRWRIPLS
jgi:hypothetical protein